MRILLVVAAVAATWAPAPASKAQTNPNPIPYYPWCAIDLDGHHGGENQSCGFVSYAQCMESARGQTAVCFENIWAVNPKSGARSDERPQRKR